jgi:hypothetical protein
MRRLREDISLRRRFGDPSPQLIGFAISNGIVTGCSLTIDLRAKHPRSRQRQWLSDNRIAIDVLLAPRSEGEFDGSTILSEAQCPRLRAGLRLDDEMQASALAVGDLAPPGASSILFDSRNGEPLCHAQNSFDG